MYVDSTSTGIRILTNSIFANGFLGIDLSPAGVTANDAGDADTGANNLQNFPVLTSAASGNSTRIRGTLNSTANTQFRLEFFSNSGCNAAAPNDYGEGRTYIGSTNLVTNASGNANLDVTLAATVPVGQYITATATDPNGNTSEFSQCRQVVAAATKTPTRTATRTRTPPRTLTRTATRVGTPTRTPTLTRTTASSAARLPSTTLCLDQHAHKLWLNQAELLLKRGEYTLPLPL